MRMMMKASIPVEAGNKAITDGTLSQTLMAFVEKFQPEASYFIAEGGTRTAVFFFDLKSTSDIPAAAESMFLTLNASVELTPAMDVADMQAGVERAMKAK